MMQWYAKALAQQFPLHALLLRRDGVKTGQIDAVRYVLYLCGNADILQKISYSLAIGDKSIKGIVNVTIAALTQKALVGLFLPCGEL